MKSFSEWKKRIRGGTFFLFTVYLLCLTYFLFFAEEYGRVAEPHRLLRYNLIPFAEISRFWRYRAHLGYRAFITNVLGNIACFVPLGFALSVLCPRMRSTLLAALSGFFSSLTIETIQLLTRVGSFDVDDLILNTLGVVCGWWVFSIVNRIRHRREEFMILSWEEDEYPDEQDYLLEKEKGKESPVSVNVSREKNQLQASRGAA